MTDTDTPNVTNEEFDLEIVKVSELKAHPRNYREHPSEQIAHLVSSITEHGFYRNVVIADDGTVLAGHGVLIAVKQMGMESIPVIRLPIGPEHPSALKVLTGDNEIAHLVSIDDLVLSKILKDIFDDSESLLGTGYNEMTFAALNVRASALEDIDEFDPNAEWEEMPEFEQEDLKAKRQILVSFDSEEDAVRFSELIQVPITPKTKALWWPFKEPTPAADQEYANDESE